MAIQAEIYVPEDQDLWSWEGACRAQAEASGLHVRGIARHWDQLVNLLYGCPHCHHEREAEVAIVPHRDMLPPERVPRLLIVAEQPRLAGLLKPGRLPRLRAQAAVQRRRSAP